MWRTLVLLALLIPTPALAVEYAELSPNGEVLRVITLVDEYSDEVAGVDFCQQLFGKETRWKKASLDGKIRKNYPGKGYVYDSALDAFVPPKEFPSWELDPASARYKPPIQMPEDGKWRWEEKSRSWVEVK